MDAPTAPDELTRTQKLDGEKHENLTNAKLHRLTEILAKGSAKKYFYRNLTGQTYGA